MSNAGNFITGKKTLLLMGVKLLMNEINFTLVTGAGGFLGSYHCVSVLETGKSFNYD